MRRTRNADAGPANKTAGSPQRPGRPSKQDDDATVDTASIPTPKRGRGRPRKVEQTVATREEASEQLLRLATIASSQLNLAPSSASGLDMVFFASSQPFGGENIVPSQAISQVNEEETFVAHGPESQEGFAEQFESENKASEKGETASSAAEAREGFTEQFESEKKASEKGESGSSAAEAKNGFAEQFESEIKTIERDETGSSAAEAKEGFAEQFKSEMKTREQGESVSSAAESREGFAEQLKIEIKTSEKSETDSSTAEAKEGFAEQFESEIKAGEKGVTDASAAKANKDDKTEVDQPMLSSVAPKTTLESAADVKRTDDINNNQLNSPDAPSRKQSDEEWKGGAPTEATASVGLFKPVVDVTSSHPARAYADVSSHPPLLFLPLFSSSPEPVPMHPAQGIMPFRRLLQPVRTQTQPLDRPEHPLLFMPLFSTSSSATSGEVNATKARAAVGGQNRTLSPLPSAVGATGIPEHPTAIPPDSATLQERDSALQQVRDIEKTETDEDGDDEEVEEVNKERKRKPDRPRKRSLPDTTYEHAQEAAGSLGKKKKRSPDEEHNEEQMDIETEEDEDPHVTILRFMDNDEYQLFLNVEEASAREFAAKEEQRARAGLAPAILPYKKHKREPPVGAPWTDEEDIMFTYLREIEKKGVKTLSATLGRSYTDVYAHLHQVRPLYRRQKEFRKLRRNVRPVEPPRSAFALFSAGQPWSEMRDRWKALSKAEVVEWEHRAVLDKERFLDELGKVGVTPEDYLRYRQLELPAKLKYNGELLEASDVRKKPRPKLPEESDEEYLASVILPREEKIRIYEAKMAAIPVWMNLPSRDKNPHDGKIPKLKPRHVSMDTGCDF